MPRYSQLTPDVRKVVDSMAKRASEKHGITLDEARENISARVTSKSTVPTHGTGH